MNVRGMLAVLLTTVLMMTACGEEPSGPVRNATPQVAWDDEDGAVQIVQGDVERTIEGQWIPWLWLPNGDLLLHTPSDSSGMGVYRPASGTFVVETDDEWGRDKYDGGEYGLDSEVGRLTAKDVPVRVVDGDDSRDPEAQTPHFLVDYDYRLTEQARVDLPGAADPRRYWRDYDFPARVGAVTFVQYEDSVWAGPDQDTADDPDGGIVRVEGDEVTSPVTGLNVRAVLLSSDARSVFAVTSDAGIGTSMDSSSFDGSRKSILELDPVTGEVARDLGSPDQYSGSDWEIERIDRVGDRVAARIRTVCSGSDGCEARSTWVTDGMAWTEVEDQRGGQWFWQAARAAVSWPTTGVDGSTDGPITWTDGSGPREVAPKGGGRRVVSGSLLPPR